MNFCIKLSRELLGNRHVIYFDEASFNTSLTITKLWHPVRGSASRVSLPIPATQGQNQTVFGACGINVAAMDVFLRPKVLFVSFCFVWVWGWCGCVWGCVWGGGNDICRGRGKPTTNE